MANTGLITAETTYLAGNDVNIAISGDINTYYHYRLYYFEQIESHSVTVFEGVVYILGNRTEMNLKDVLAVDHRQAFARRYYMALIGDDGTEYGTVSFMVYTGGISRYFRESPQSFVHGVLKNPDAMFFLSTRSRGNILVLPENELAPLAYYKAGMKFTIGTISGDLRGYDYSEVTEEEVGHIDLSELRRACITQFDAFASAFYIHAETGQDTNIILTDERPSNGILIRFINSLGAYEYINLCGKIVLGSEISDEVAYNVGDRKTILRRLRKYVASSYIYPLNDDDRLWINDLAHSNDVSISVSGSYYPIIVNLDTKNVLSTEWEATLIPIDIEFADSESHFSNSQSELYRYLQTMAKENIQDNPGNDILV